MNSPPHSDIADQGDAMDQKRQNPYAELAKLGGELPAPKKPEALFGGTYSGNMLGQMRKQMTELFPDHSHGERAPREMEGRALKRIGKETGNESLVAQGRKLQYGHLTPEELLQQHPSAFLRKNTLRSNFLQPGDSPLVKGDQAGFHGKAKRETGFQLMSHAADAKGFEFYSVENDKIVDSASGTSRSRKQAYSLIPSHLGAEGLKLYRDMTGQDAQLGPTMTGAFLPMVQAKFDTLRSKPSKKNVNLFKEGTVNTDHLATGHSVFTTELTGCSVVRQQSSLHHIRPNSDGAKMQKSFPSSQSYGRLDYPDANNSFVMMRTKPDGRVKLYYQTHQDNQPSTSGSRYLSK
jgi:hypothetical protein